MRKFAASTLAMLAGLAAPAFALDVTGSSFAASWGAASGPVAGYAVQVSRNGGAYVELTRVTGRSTRVSGRVGETVRVRVVAFDSVGRTSPPSAPSEAVNFIQGPTPPPGGGGGDPVVDVDGNGMTDSIAYHAKTRQLSVLLLNADGSRDWQVIGAPDDDSMRAVGIADVDADGQADVLWRSASSGDNEIWRMNGMNYSVLALPNQPATFSARAFRDFSGDGRADVLFHDAASGQSVIWTLNAAGRSAVLDVDAAPSGHVLLAIADLDGSGSPDLVWRNLANNSLEAWAMSGADPVASFTLPAVTNQTLFGGAGDLDSDGDDDLVWIVRERGKRRLHAWFVNGANAPARGVALGIGKRKLRGVVDVNDDGRADLVVAGKKGFSATSVGTTGANDENGDFTWNTQSLNLDEVPASKRWYFLVVE